MLKNPIGIKAEKIGLIYAWNEYGEGAFLTPTKEGINYSKYIKNATRETKNEDINDRKSNALFQSGG